MMSEWSDLRRTIEDAAQGLVYSSDSDRLFEWFELPAAGEGWPYGVEEFARRMRTTLGTPLEERTLDRFFARHVELADPQNAQSQAIRPRYEALKQVLTRVLRDVRAFRVGRTEIDCYVVGEDGAGNLAGLHTVAMET